MMFDTSRFHSTRIACFLAGAAALASASATSAGLLASYQPVTADGAYTDAWGSNGSYFYGQTIAAQFSLAQDSILDGFTVWGGSENFISPGLGNVTGVEVIIWNADFSQQVISTILGGGDLDITATGQTNSNGGFQYRIGGALAGVLAAGTYHLNVGAILADPDGDAFAWSTSAGSGFSANAFDGFGWEGSSAFDIPAFEILGSVVPTPGAIAVLGLVGLVGARRRRA